MEYKKTKLNNGLTVITIPMKNSPSVTVMTLVKTGSEYETKEQNGISHFLEHMCFKGTEKRPRPLDIAIETDSMGSISNAFTSTEWTNYFIKSHSKHAEKVLDIVSDIYLNSTLPSEEIEKERGVIIEEINMYEDYLPAKVQFVLMELMYGNQPAGRSIVGPKENIKSISREDFIEYRKKHYVASATTVVVAGDFGEAIVVQKIENLFSGISTGDKSLKQKVTEAQTEPALKIHTKESDQTHICIAIRTFDAHDKRNTTLKVLVSVLSGGMSGRLWRKLREEMGACYYVHAQTEEATDHGFLAISSGIDLNRIEEITLAIIAELNRFKNEIISEEELKKAKDYAIGGMYLDLESSNDVARYYANQDAIGVPIITPEELADKMQQITAQDIQNLAKEIFVDESLNMAVVGNIKDDSNLKKILHF
ncbi:MAG: pitrilysin family protein [Patescibacteria group bacterium]